ncbi:SEC-C metal-binding domain-containing protein [Peribacillus frigoritolerans]|uniref:SEC-C metal-binding domain-containing protein n=1 Tax=Peribacillus frigoritolerans TaxID=450367 RepID=UPI00105A5E72|nr:SEC-C metal-binding domain-containing protein [Peribacillus frigoritolerans]TDL78979.1 tetratricopeptide repeat protein [Peribacillus frigoritolerans]
MDIGRNDPCHCGSGKKYKKCCMKKETSIEAIRHEELDKIQGELMEFASVHFGRQIDVVIKEKMGNLDREEFKNVYGALLIWAVFSVTFANGKIIDAFVEKKRSETIRPSTISQLEKWKETVPTFSIIESVINDEWINVKDIFSEDIKKVKVEALSFEEGGMLLGYLLPYGDYYMYYLMGLGFEKQETAQNSGLTKQLFEESKFNHPEQFMIDHFPEMILQLLGESEEEAPKEESKEETSEELEWEDLNYHNTALKLEINLVKAELEEQTREQSILVLHKYLHRVKPVVKKQEIFAAAMHYFIEKHMHKQGLTQKKLAEMYEVSVSSLSKAYREMKDGLEADLQTVSAPVTQKFYAERPASSDKEYAQELIFKAMESAPIERVKLAEEALEVYPYHPDAYNMLGEAERDPEKQLQLFKKGMEVGETDLGETYFKENKGSFWGLSETRPYMRAKFNYAMLEAAVGSLEKAAEQCAELLELNQNDNQGVRYTLFVMYMDLGKYNEAKKLLDEYDERHSVEGAYNQALIEYALNGMTETFKKLVKNAKNINPYVFDYLTGKQKLQAAKSIDQQEAAQYVQEHYYVWAKHPELFQWVMEAGK